jgi:hypothetical protein
MPQVDNKYSTAVIKLKNGKKIEFNPNDVTSIMDAVAKINGVVSVNASFSEAELKREWMEEVANGNTELSLVNWLQKMKAI